VDARVLAATARDSSGSPRGAVREDLFYRIHVVVIELPPLREREDDIAPRPALRRPVGAAVRPTVSLSDARDRVARATAMPGTCANSRTRSSARRCFKP